MTDYRDLDFTTAETLRASLGEVRERTLPDMILLALAAGESDAAEIGYRGEAYDVEAARDLVNQVVGFDLNERIREILAMNVEVARKVREGRAKMPERIQLSRRRGWRKPENTVVVARPSKWGNPFKVGETAMVETNWYGAPATIEFDMTAALAVELYRQRFIYDAPEIRAELGGKNLGCWCKLDQPCHADVLLEIANGAEA